MLAIIIGNILSIIAIGFTYMNGQKKEKRDMLMYDIGAAGCFTLADLVLKGYSGVVQNLVGVFRNIVAIFMPKDKYIGWILVACGVIFGVWFNNHGFIGLLPVATSFWYSINVVDKNASGRKLKMALILNNFAYALYSAVLFNVVGFVSDTFVGCATLHSYLKNRKED